jgi:hypothetical protein
VNKYEQEVNAKIMLKLEYTNYENSLFAVLQYSMVMMLIGKTGVILRELMDEQFGRELFIMHSFHKIPEYIT